MTKRRASPNRKPATAKTKHKLPPFHQLYVFYWCAKTGSKADAAATMGIARPTVAEHIEALEKTLRTDLFDRTHKVHSLTRAGERLYDKIQVPFATLTEVLQAGG